MTEKTVIIRWLKNVFGDGFVDEWYEQNAEELLSNLSLAREG